MGPFSILGNYNVKEFRPGFRLSKLDIVILILGVMSALWVTTISIFVSYIIVYVVGHFFMFCNLFRLSRAPELVWAVIFLSLCTLSIKWQLFDVVYAFITQTLMTLVLVALELRKSSYHSVGWKKVNPNLKVWFQAQST